MSIKAILDEIASDNSRLHKEKVLRDNKHNRTLEAVIRATYDPFTQYYVREYREVLPEDNMCEAIHSLGEMDLIDAIDHLGVLSRREKTGDEGRHYLARIWECLSDNDREVLSKILDGKLHVGISAKTANKIWQGIIPEYPCMLAASYSEKAIGEINYPAYSQTKMDGMRCNIRVQSDGTVEVRSRQGKLFETHGVFDKEGKQMRDFLDLYNEGFAITLDGELICKGEDGEILPRQIGNGICNKANKGTISEKEASMLVMTVWDYIPEPVFCGDVEDPLRYCERFDLLEKAFEKDYNALRLVETKIVYNLDEARSHYKEMLDRGEEGTILKDRSFGWKNTRSKLTVKFKEIKDIDLRVIDWKEGTGRNVGLLGALTAETEDGKIRVNVGTGFSDEQRKEYTREFVVGRIIEIEYNQRISSEGRDTDSLFLPRFIELREDKDVANSSEGV